MAVFIDTLAILLHTIYITTAHSSMTELRESSPRLTDDEDVNVDEVGCARIRCDVLTSRSFKPCRLVWPKWRRRRNKCV